MYAKLISISSLREWREIKRRKRERERERGRESNIEEYKRVEIERNCQRGRYIQNLLAFRI